MGQAVVKERGKRYVGLPEFAQTGGKILAEMALDQARGTVTSVPDERTIRYYMSEGLIQTPEEKQGTASVFEYRQLLQLVTVKKLQAEHFPIRKIRELVAGKSEQDLETLLGVAGTSTKKTRETEARQYLESLLTPAPPASQSQISTPPVILDGSPPLSLPSPSQHTNDSHSWQRIEIEPGLELHVRSDYSPPPTTVQTKTLLEKVIHRLRRLRG